MPIVLMTDFGTADAYAGILKGVIARIAPAIPVMDLTHEIPPFDILQGAFALSRSYAFYPTGSVFVAVVDPGVGSSRKPILAETEHFNFIAPDNGLLTLVLDLEKPQRVICLDNPRYHLTQVSETFHGRDIFSPVAAHLANGIPVGELGSPLKDYARLSECFPRKENGRMIGRVISTDRFGNCLTNVARATVEAHLKKNKPRLKLKGRKKVLQTWVHHYSEGPKGKPLLLWSSSGFLEIAFREGNASAALKIKTGQEFSVE
jgi:S-adenosylmethionine hydrolase